MRAIALILMLGLILVACSGSNLPQNAGLYMLVDTSGTYTQEIKKAQQIITVILARINPGDSFAVASIDTGSFSEKDIVAKKTFDERPSVTNKQKRQFKNKIDTFVSSVKPSRYTDITGGLLQGIEYLKEKNTGKKTIIIFSDLQEELPKGYNRDVPLDLLGFNIVAVNVTKLNADNRDPSGYLSRLDNWKKRIELGGGTWMVINDLDHLDKVLPQ